VGQVIFARRPPGQQVEMLAGMLEVLLNWFRPPRPGPVSTPSGSEHSGQDRESLVKVDVADEFKLNVYDAPTPSP
jgi:hypothetical protein